MASEKIKFVDLSLSLKILVILTWILLAINGAALLIGFTSVILGGSVN